MPVKKAQHPPAEPPMLKHIPIKDTAVQMAHVNGLTTDGRTITALKYFRCLHLIFLFFYCPLVKK